MSRKTNIHYVYDKIEPHKKLATYEYGYENHVLTTNLANERITKLLKSICSEIKRRVNSIYYYKHKTVIRGVEAFKETDFNESKFF
jgi:hypothetical protein